MSRDALLQSSVDAAVVRLAQDYLDAARAASARLAAPAPNDALHDFRVALRRLRSILRSYRPQLHTPIAPRREKKLRRLARATNAGRDAEVGLEWLATQQAGLTPVQRSGAQAFANRLADRRDTAYGALQDRMLADFESLEAKLRRDLTLSDTEPVGSAEYAAVTAESIHTMTDRLGQQLAQIESPEDGPEAHEARIVAKRLRYLIEPLVGEIPSARTAVRHLRQLQDLLGDLNDRYVIAAELARAAQDSGAARAVRLYELSLAPGRDRAALRALHRDDALPGLIALGRRALRSHARLFAQLKTRYLTRNADLLIARCRRVGLQLATRAAHARHG